jgi:hypothetical protein
LKRELRLSLLSPLCCYNSYYSCYNWMHDNTTTTPSTWGGNGPPPLPFFLSVISINASDGEVAMCKCCCYHLYDCHKWDTKKGGWGGKRKEKNPPLMFLNTFFFLP